MFKNISKKRLTILLVSLLSVVAISVGVTLAYVLTKTDEVENEFKPSKVACAVVEKLDGTQQGEVTGDQVGETENEEFAIKSDVQIKNTGDTDAYIRVAVVVTWKKADGTVWAQTPVAGTDYTAWTPGADWTKIGDYYYYTQPVKPTNTTGTLINTIEVLDTANIPDGYYLSIEIVASAIQAKPSDVVEEQWGVSVGSSGITAKN